MRVSNPEKGRRFREAAHPILEVHLGVRLSAEIRLSIGSPAKLHKFDLVADDRTWVLECKALAWRQNGGVPQAKITSITEAALCLRDLERQGSERAIVLERATHAQRRETLAEYYVRLHSHNLARSVGLIEIDPVAGSLRWLIRNDVSETMRKHDHCSERWVWYGG